MYHKFRKFGQVKLDSNLSTVLSYAYLATIFTGEEMTILIFFF